MGKKKLIDYEHISNRAFMDVMYRKNSVNTGEPCYYCVPMELAVDLFGEEASDFLYEVSQGLCVSYTTFLNGVKYVTATGFSIMKYYRAMCIYKEKNEMWLQENEVAKNDTGGRKQNQSKRVSRKRKEV